VLPGLVLDFRAIDLIVCIALPDVHSSVSSNRLIDFEFPEVHFWYRAPSLDNEVIFSSVEGLIHI